MPGSSRRKDGIQFACVGGIHGFWEDSDTEYFNASSYDLLLLRGDLPDSSRLPSIPKQIRYENVSWKGRDSLSECCKGTENGKLRFCGVGREGRNGYKKGSCQRNLYRPVYIIN